MGRRKGKRRVNWETHLFGGGMEKKHKFFRFLGVAPPF